MNSGEQKRALGIFPNRQDAEFALSELKEANFTMDRVSVVAHDGSNDEEIAGAEISESLNDSKDEKSVTNGTIAGGTLGGITGLLVSVGALVIPGIGSITVAGSAIATVLSSSVIGAATGGIIGALISLGIPEDEAIIYQRSISQGQYLVMIEGSDDDMCKAASILLEFGIKEWKIYNAYNIYHKKSLSWQEA